MSPNGRRFWRSWAKSYRRWLNRDDRRRYRDLYDDEPLVKHQYTWFEAKKQFGPGLLCSKAKPLAPRSLVGMTQGARKRAARQDAMGVRTAVHDFRTSIRIGETLRPCPGCCACSPCNVSRIHLVRLCTSAYPRTICDGSGVLPARRA